MGTRRLVDILSFSRAGLEQVELLLLYSRATAVMKVHFGTLEDRHSLSSLGASIHGGDMDSVFRYVSGCGEDWLAVVLRHGFVPMMFDNLEPLRCCTLSLHAWYSSL